MTTRFEDINVVISQFCNKIKDDPKLMADFVCMEIAQYFRNQRKYDDLSIESQEILKLIVRKVKV